MSLAAAVASASSAGACVSLPSSTLRGEGEGRGALSTSVTARSASADPRPHEAGDYAQYGLEANRDGVVSESGSDVRLEAGDFAVSGSGYDLRLEAGDAPGSDQSAVLDTPLILAPDPACTTAATRKRKAGDYPEPGTASAGAAPSSPAVKPKAKVKKPKPPRTFSFDHALYGELSPEDFNPASPPLQLSATGELTLDPDRTVQILAPGLVVIKNCVDAATQHWLARMAMQRGTKPFPDGFYKTVSEVRVQPPSLHPATSAAAAAIAAPTRVPNSKESCGRGRVYDAAGTYPNALGSVCKAVMKDARRVQTLEQMPDMTATHVLMVHYSRGRNVRPSIFWHKDDAASDGTSDHPVVSLSIGESCTFKLMNHWSYQKYKSIEAAGGLHTVTLQSGDAILMGGPARMMHHTVASVQKNTCPAALKPLLGDARINITFRDAPGINAKDYKMYNV